MTGFVGGGRRDGATSRGIVVTGAGNGIGRAIATKLAAEGERVVVNDLDADAVATVAAEIGGFAVPGDAAGEAGARALVEAARDHLGDIDIWFGNAGIDHGRGLDATEADWELSWSVNVMAHVRAARLLVPAWAERGSGRYVATASAAGLLTMLGTPTYSTTKHAVIGFAEWLSATYRHRGVVVQAICPQGVRTRMFDDAGPLQGLLAHDSALTPEQLADTVWEALGDERFLILPHPQVAGYYATRAAHTDKWLAGMNKIQRGLEQQGAL
ncbi:SDR family NAD(P)-dependent oxidoreductase [Tsukamurella sp. 8F]|uniref:SDR family oxidoreductase n=1 Tax=unclassified Tsukamurella TaxID=2633480 RepID=UPI0023B98EFB|nr:MULTISPECIES: SDR family oxidoreductase [unclassified Tsukamurella]MDF0531276.1 SDR family NAD(P)-dependent oxidoreductase [Tsukamurella sp. 8J]MDF0585225.1 SDR family NAD(P)-dependent oxidoreductase [Tsukamurella sp. 8F]